MSGTFPTTPAPASMKLRSVQPTLISVAHSLKRQTRSRGGQRWGFSLAWNNLDRAQLAVLLAFAIAQRGQYGTFQFVPAVIGNGQTTVAGTPRANGAQDTGRSIVTDGWAISATPMKAGDFVKFSGHAKVYMLTADVTSNGSGAATLTIEPALYQLVADNEIITVENVPFTVALSADTHEIDMAPGVRYDWSCDLVESP